MIFFLIFIPFRLQDVKDEFDDFQEGSRELEAELEAQLEQYEKRVKELVSVRSSLEDENETLKVRNNLSLFVYVSSVWLTLCVKLNQRIAYRP